MYNGRVAVGDKGDSQGVFVSANSLLDDAIADVGLDEVRLMPLEAGELPPPFENYDLSRESDLDNRTMARFGFPGSSEERFREAGRIGGYMREMLSAVPSFGSDGADFMLSTVAHLFHTPEDVLGWMHDVFLRDFEANVGVEIGSGQRLVAARRLQPRGFMTRRSACGRCMRTGIGWCRLRLWIFGWAAYWAWRLWGRLGSIRGWSGRSGWGMRWSGGL